MHVCKECNYCSDRQRDYAKHLTTVKHKKNVGEWVSEPEPSQNLEICSVVSAESVDSDKVLFECDKCPLKYKTRSGLWKHQKSHDNNENINEIKQLLIHQMQENNEIRNIIFEQSNIIAEIVKTPTTVINNHFNINVFLNEYCREALNIMDFVNNLQIEYPDVEYVGKHGFVEGITNIFLKGLQKLDIYKRPIHCTDIKRETLYIKDNNVWEKDTEDKLKMQGVIRKISRKNATMIASWAKKHPEALRIDTNEFNKHMTIMKESMGGSSMEQLQENVIKITKKVSRGVFIRPGKEPQIKN